MDYPDTDEEFELMHAQELEMLREMEEEFDSAENVSYTKSKRSLNFEENKTSNKRTTSIQKVYNYESDLDKTTIASCSTHSSQELDKDCIPLSSLDIPTVEDLFGDIDDIDGDQRAHKKPRLDSKLTPDEVKEILIKQIINERKQNETNVQKRNKKVLEFREENIKNCVSKKVPKWPFVPLTDANHQRFYFRLRSHEFIDNKVTEAFYEKKSGSGLLDNNFEELKQRALEEVLNKEKKATDSEAKRKHVTVEAPNQDLWVERYKPKNYCQLLSDESTNRALLYWLKQWDKIVFNREPPRQHENKKQQQQRTGPTSYFNKNSNWNHKNDASDLVFKLDEHGRPYYKLAMLCGPPGLGKTTLAHMLAKQAGYNVVEVNASDDRSVHAFRTQLEAATQMKAVMGAEPKPNCLILDEIDGAPQQSVDFLVKFVSDKVVAKGRKGNKNGNKGLIKRPIICICNDVYVPALRPLRQIAYTLNVPCTSSARLGERLIEITRKEGINTDLGTMVALSEKTNNDIRSCLSCLYCMKAGDNKVTLTQVHAANIGTKDTQQGLFPVWQSIFHYKHSRNNSVPMFYNKRPNSDSDQTSNELAYRLENVRRTVQSFGDYDRLAMGVFENYLRLKTIDPSMKSISSATQWFCFHDIISTWIQSSQVYTLYPYLVYSFVGWHLLFASVNWPKIVYPHTSYEMKMKAQRLNQVVQFTLAGMPAHVQAYQDRLKLMLDIVPYLIELIVPSLRPVSVQLYTPKERKEVERVTLVMVDYNLSYTQERTQEGSYHYKLDPDIEEVGLFGDRERSRIFSYTGKQIISREVETEKLKRLTSHTVNTSALVKTTTGVEEIKAADQPPPASPKVNTEMKSPAVPNHLQKLTPKTLKKSAEVKEKDFFGRIVTKTLDKQIEKAKTEDIVKSNIWYHFKEGYNNAVRKCVLMSELY